MSSLWNKPSSNPDRNQTVDKAPDDVTDIGPGIRTSSSSQSQSQQQPRPQHIQPQQQQQQQPVFSIQLGADRSTAPPAVSRPIPFNNNAIPPGPAAPIPGRKSSIDGRIGPVPSEGPQDSLSLGQLKKIVAGFQRPEKTSCYDYTYTDYGPFADEIDEWFVDKAWNWDRLINAQNAFNWQWEDATHSLSGMISEKDPAVEGLNIEESTTWDQANQRLKDGIVKGALDVVQTGESSDRTSAIGSLTYLALGRWTDTGISPLVRSSISHATDEQVDAMVETVRIITKLDGLPIIWKALLKALNALYIITSGFDPTVDADLTDVVTDMMNLMTIMYVVIQVALSFPKRSQDTTAKLVALEPSLPDTFLQETSRRRFDDGDYLPQTQLLLLLWKSILIVFGGSHELLETKKAASETSLDDKANNLILASPLDYHFFRSEITSKYPAYIPPQSNLPYDNLGKNILAVLAPQAPKTTISGGILPPAPGAQVESGSSILNQPVRIATPAPSPPPSPAGGGKGAKKQNYQTNQNFPFLYPPLDATSNSAGGKGFAGEQWEIVGRRFEGSDLPASIIEAGALFSDRVRMTRAMRQLWEEREAFLKEDKGWDPDTKPDEEQVELDDDIESLDLSELTAEEKEELARIRKQMHAAEDKIHVSKAELGLSSIPLDLGPNADNMDPEIKRRLESVEKFYQQGMPHFQSMVIVLLKTIMANVASLPVPVPQSAHPMGQARGVSTVPEIVRSPAEMDFGKGHEVTAKAVTGILILILKWFKVSHVLKFEFMTQLLLDSNYLPLVLKFFVHQEIPNIVESKTDRNENCFFHMCNVQAKRSVEKSTSGHDGETEDVLDSSEDDAMPPPIKRRKSPPLPPLDTGTPASAATTRPEVDELGFPVNADVPLAPVTDFSRRNFFSLINYLRIMQKICKGKVHRNLLMVTYKSSNILRKSLRVPQDELRLYTLKLIKSQVPYCGRKWRQGHMRVITAIYLHCRPELKDEWLAGSDVDGEIESALPLEQALRSLTHWFNVRRYPEVVAAADSVRAAMRIERDFFAREVDKIDFGDVGSINLEDSNTNMGFY